MSLKSNLFRKKDFNDLVKDFAAKNPKSKHLFEVPFKLMLMRFLRFKIISIAYSLKN